MAGECPYHDEALPQWCGDCGGFIGWCCAMCGATMPDAAVSPAHCRCLGGSRQWVDGPEPTTAWLSAAAAGLGHVGARTNREISEYMAAAMVTPDGRGGCWA